MPTNNPGDNARTKLLAIERRRQMAVVSEFEKIQTRLTSELIDLLERIDKQRKYEGNASPGLLIQKARLSELLDAVTAEIATSSKKFAAITAGAQNAAVDIAAEQAAEYPELVGDLNFFDGPATRQLINLAGDGQPLAIHFAKLAKPIRQAMFDSLFFGIAAGKPNEQIAREVREAIGGTRAAAMTIVRTETNRAYREASRTFYDEVPAVIGWRWLAALDLRTCPICWALHGRTFKTKTKFGTHPNCRCSMVPVFEGDEKAETGPQIFAKLNDAQRRTILGPRRLERYLQGAELRDFVETNKSAFGIGRNIKPLARTTFKIRPRDPNPPDPPRLIVIKPTPDLATPTKALKQAKTTTPKTATPARFNASTIRADFLKTATTARAKANFVDNLADLEAVQKAANKEFWDKRADFWSGKLPGDDWEAIKAAQVVANKAISDHLEKLEKFRTAERQLLKSGESAGLKPEFVKGSFPKTKPERAERVNYVVDELNGLIDPKGWPGRTQLKFRHTKGRAFYTHHDRTVNVNFDDANRIRVIAHEMAHSLEMSNIDNLEAANAFLDYRTAGEKLRRLKDLYPGYDYRASELTRADKFKNAYVGKQYGPIGRQYATEVISMGIEDMFEDPVKFALEDPEYFDFILHIMRGEKWSKPK